MRKHRPLTGLGTLAALLLAALSPLRATALDFTAVSSPDLDLSGLGRVAVVGDFDSISVYQYAQQSEEAYTTNGSQALLGRYPDGSFGPLANSDGNIYSMCPFIEADGTLAGIVVGGNFTSLGGVEAQGIALFDPTTSAITPLPGLSGSVSSIYCDTDSATVYVGGSFSGGNSTNAIAWVTGWTNLPFAGFNGPVSSVIKTSDGRIVFGGSFDGLGNTTTPTQANDQIVSINSANVTSDASSSLSGFDDPFNIVCKDYTEQGAGLTWLLANDSAGYWDASFGFGFIPTVLRLYNTDYEGRGTQTFSMTALPLNGIMNLSYVDTEGQTQYCTAECPLPEGNTTAQDFTLVNSVGMNEVRIDISAWYGDGAGLNGIVLLEEDLYSFAIADFNEPSCSSTTVGANATTTGPWVFTPSGESNSDYLTANITDGTIDADTANVIFLPDIKQSGNYSITMYTPGCVGDDTCSTRGMVNITGLVSATGTEIATIVYQTNDYDKYDQIYYGYVDATSDTFEPQVTLQPQSGQTVPLTLVAQKIRFELVDSTGGLNGLYAYDPAEATVDTDYSESVIDTAGSSLTSGATISALAVVDTNLYVGGSFTADGINNIFSVSTANATSLPGEGLNNDVETIYQNGSMLYVGGNFTATGDDSVSDLNGVAAFDVTSNEWSPLGTGVNGTVTSIVPLQVNVTSGDLQDCIAVSGSFTIVNAFGSNDSFAADGIAIWVPSAGNWLYNVAETAISLSGSLDAQTSIPNNTALYAGSVVSQYTDLANAVALSGNGLPSLVSLGITITANDSSSTSTAGNAYSGAVAGLFYDGSGLNITALGGSFTATDSNGSTIYSFAVITGDSPAEIYGLPSGIAANTTILAMDNVDATIFLGGNVSGTVGSNTVNGFLIYDLSSQELASTQPPALHGDSVVVNSVVVQPGSSNVYVGGDFSTAGSLGCPALCLWDASTSQWMIPATGLSGVITTMLWASDTKLVLAGNLTADGNVTTILNYDSKTETFSEFPGADSLPGTVTSLTPANSEYTQYWASGTDTDGAAWLQTYNGSSWTAITGFGSTSSIRSLQVMTTTSDHAQSSYLADNEVLLITGSIDVPDFGNASAALYNGTTYTPFLLSDTSDNGQGSVGRIFVQNPGNFLSSSHHYLARGFVVLIALAIALALIFLLVVVGILLERYRRKREGYAPVKQLTADQQANLGRIPPERLFGSIGEKSPAPKI